MVQRMLKRGDRIFNRLGRPALHHHVLQPIGDVQLDTAFPELQMYFSHSALSASRPRSLSCAHRLARDCMMVWPKRSAAISSSLSLSILVLRLWICPRSLGPVDFRSRRSASRSYGSCGNANGAHAGNSCGRASSPGAPLNQSYNWSDKRILPAIQNEFSLGR